MKKFDVANALIESGVSISEACEIAKLSRSTYHRIKNGGGPDKPTAVAQPKESTGTDQSISDSKVNA